MAKQPGLVLDMRPGDSLNLDGERIKVELLHKSGQLARLRVLAPPDVKIEKARADTSAVVPSLA